MAARGWLRRCVGSVAAAGLVAPLAIGGAEGTAAAQAGAAPGISLRGPAVAVLHRADSERAFTLPVPAGAQPGDLLLAAVGVGDGEGDSGPRVTAPDGWTPASETRRGRKGVLAVFHHVLAAGDQRFTFRIGGDTGGVGVIAAFAGVDTADPVDAAAGAEAPKGGREITAPGVTTTVDDTLLVANYLGYRKKKKQVTTWTAPAGMTEIADADDEKSRHSASMHIGGQAAAGATGSRKAVASNDQDWGIGALTALRPAPPPPPLITNLRGDAITATRATLTWNTSRPADTRVEYGPTSSYGSSSPLDPALVTSHRVVLSGLDPGTTYHIRVHSRAATGPPATAEATFDTAGATPPGPVPLIVDTDLFSDAGDAGALAGAFGLQVAGEAEVVAVGISTRLSRPAVAANSWKCAAAIAHFYDSGHVPIGTALPNDGTAVNTVDFTGPCAALAPPGTPVPPSAVEVYRQVLAARPDSSVAIATTGYLGNIAALLASPPDAVSPLDGRDLVARKVRSLHVMGGGYPTRPGETNLSGDPPAARAVADGWPTKLVWAGYEVGDVLHTGSVISSTHPPASPVRAAYEAFVGPNNWVFGYDDVPVHHAVRPHSGHLAEVGPGLNAIDAAGGNVFTAGSGDQWYLTLNDAAALTASIDAVVASLPLGPGPNDSFDLGVVDPLAWIVRSTGSAVQAANGQLEILHLPGPWTTGTIDSARPHDHTGRTLQVRVNRAANDGKGGSPFGETSVRLLADSTHYAEFFIAGGTITARVNQGSGPTKLTTGWPAWPPGTQRWVRFREDGGTLHLEMSADGAAWTSLGSVATPFALERVKLRIVAGTNTTAGPDVAAFDDIATT